MAHPAILQEVEIATTEAAKLISTKPIKTPEDLAAAKAQRDELIRVRKNIVEKRESFNRPARLAIKETTDLFQVPINTLKDAEAAIKAHVTAYNQK